MNIKRLFPIILVLVMVVPAVYATDDSIGVITGLQLHKSEISIGNQIYTIDPFVRIHALEGDQPVEMFILKIDMMISFSYEEGAKKINEIWILAENAGDLI